jgi:hypothetical protein
VSPALRAASSAERLPERGAPSLPYCDTDRGRRLEAIDAVEHARGLTESLDFDPSAGMQSADFRHSAERHRHEAADAGKSEAIVVVAKLVVVVETQSDFDRNGQADPFARVSRSRTNAA